ncbi:MAG: hypothetical protein B6240_12760 [Desulfobacteraceae bacterium 4572_87]|nr:MAG: hypothetical protein B6240_12760 [Desulfobacteraceae bacterium 4572_87]
MSQRDLVIFQRNTVKLQISLIRRIVNSYLTFRCLYEASFKEHKLQGAHYMEISELKRQLGNRLRVLRSAI